MPIEIKNFDEIEKDETKKLEKFIAKIELAAWREEIARAVLKIADSDKKRLEIFGFQGDMPPMSQIGGLRSTIGRLKKIETDNDSDSNVSNWITHLENTSNRLKKSGKNESEAKKTLKKIKDFVQSEDLILEKLESKNEKAFFKKPNSILSDTRSQTQTPKL